MYLRSIILTSIAFFFFLIPFTVSILNINDPGLKNGEIPLFTYQWHQKLSGELSVWANGRVESAKALELDTYDISGTEWPLFNAVYFLWATETLQDNWEKDTTLSSSSPNLYASNAVEASARLISDPNHANWVKAHWGDDYLHQENIFYRMLLIAGLTSYQKLTGNEQYQDLLVDQIESLSNELDASPYGLLDDYPGQCYPIDILPALAVIQRADKILGSDHSTILARSLRAFSENRIDSSTGLPAYIANSKTGLGLGSARGVGISYMLIWAPELWPDTANEWYESYEKYFWKEGIIISGFREFSKELNHSDYFFDVDAGPVIEGYGVAASAFGIGAARVNNRFEHAYPLAAEAVVASWPLPNGTLLVPRLLSNLSDAPYLGETALLFNMTREPIVNSKTKEKSSLPLFVYLVLLFYGLSGVILLSVSVITIWNNYK